MYLVTLGFSKVPDRVRAPTPTATGICPPYIRTDLEHRVGPGDITSSSVRLKQRPRRAVRLSVETTDLVP